MSDPLKPHEKRHLRTKRAILDAARKLLVEKGANGVSLRAIAREVDYSPAGLYEYFDGIEDIVLTVCEEGHLGLMHALEKADESLPFQPYMLELGLAYLDFARSNPDYFMLMFTTIPKGGRIEEFMTEGSAFPILVRGVERGIKEGILQQHPGGVDAMALIFWTGVHGLAMLEQTQLKNADIDFELMGRAVCMNIFQGLVKEG